MDIRKIADSTKTFVQKHRVAVAIASTATVFVMLNKRNAVLLDQFLIDHDIDPDTYWLPEE